MSWSRWLVPAVLSVPLDDVAPAPGRFFCRASKADLAPVMSPLSMLSTSDFIAPPRGEPWFVVDETCW